MAACESCESNGMDFSGSYTATASCTTTGWSTTYNRQFTYNVLSETNCGSGAPGIERDYEYWESASSQTVNGRYTTEGLALEFSGNVDIPDPDPTDPHIRLTCVRIFASGEFTLSMSDE